MDQTKPLPASVAITIKVAGEDVASLPFIVQALAERMDKLDMYESIREEKGQASATWPVFGGPGECGTLTVSGPGVSSTTNRASIIFGGNPGLTEVQWARVIDSIPQHLRDALSPSQVVTVGHLLVQAQTSAAVGMMMGMMG